MGFCEFGGGLFSGTRVLPDSFRSLQPFAGEFSRRAEIASPFEPVIPVRFHLGGDSDLNPATSGLRHQTSRRVNGTDTACRICQ
jgi:hypothetical protein